MGNDDCAKTDDARVRMLRTALSRDDLLLLCLVELRASNLRIRLAQGSEVAPRDVGGPCKMLVHRTDGIRRPLNFEPPN